MNDGTVTIKDGETKFACDYQSCNCILHKKRTNAFRCTMCGHGSMREVKIKARCCECGGAIYDNVDLYSHKKGKKREKVFTVTCGNCTMATVRGIALGEEKNKERKEYEQTM